ncbi:MAG: universal stress protein [Candidatus Neomarinimicrobiota bacterium]
MRFLIAISSIEYSEPTLRVGLEIARAFKACVTVACVGNKPSSFAMDQVRLAQESMERWDFDQPAVDVLEWAYDYLVSFGFVKEGSVSAGFQKTLLSERAGDRGEINLEGIFCDRVSLILRYGDIISELRDEVNKHKYEVTIIGGSQKRRMAHDLVQFIDSSILVIRNFDFNQPYRLLLAVDDSRGTLKAVNYGIQIASALGVEADVLTVSKRKKFGPGYLGASERACRYLENAGVSHERQLKIGDPATVIMESAGANDIIVMGVSGQNPFKKFFVGSKPLKVLSEGRGTVLIVK